MDNCNTVSYLDTFQAFAIATASRVFFQISMNARPRGLVTPTPTAPTLLAHLSVFAGQDTQETAVTAQVGIW